MTDADTLRAQMAASTDPARLEREAMRAQLVVMPEAPDGATLDAIGHKLYPYARGLGEFERRMARQIYTHVREALSEPRVVKMTQWCWAELPPRGGVTHSFFRKDDAMRHRSAFVNPEHWVLVELSGDYEVQS